MSKKAPGREGMASREIGQRVQYNFWGSMCHLVCLRSKGCVKDMWEIHLEKQVRILLQRVR